MIEITSGTHSSNPQLVSPCVPQQEGNNCQELHESKYVVVHGFHISQADMCNYRAFRDRSMKLGKMLEHTIRKFCGYRDN